jgi:glycosyltransferase involved in cell wall biosynthesis
VRVALLTHNAPAGDAIGNQVAEKLTFFLDRGADVRVFVEADRRLHPTVRPYCRVIPEPETEGAGWKFLSEADLIIVDYAQYYHLLELLPLLAAGVFREAATSLFRPRILFDYHGVTPPGLWENHNREALEKGSRQRGLVWCADAALAHSRFAWQELSGQTDFPAERVYRLEYPVDTTHFTPGRPRRGLRDKLRLPQDASMLLFVGRVAPNKRLSALIEALAHLQDVTPQIHGAIIGDISDVYQEEAQRCRRRAAQLGLIDRVHFLGQVREDQLLDAYRSADVFVMPSVHEGFCIPVIEAMACGLPVVAACATALPETVADAGLTFIPDHPGDLARQVRRVLGEQPNEQTSGRPNPPDLIQQECRNHGSTLAEHMRRHGLLHAAKHERSAWRNRFGRIVEELLDNPPRPRREKVEVRSRSRSRVVEGGAESVLVPVHIANRGTHALLSDGPGRIVLRSLVVDELGEPCALPALDSPLPQLLIPGQEIAAMMRVPVPASAGSYEAALLAVPQWLPQDGPPDLGEINGLFCTESSFRLIVEPGAAGSQDCACAASSQSVQAALAEAECRQNLPSDYIDVSEGFLAKWKRWIKRKLLANFKHAYVDVLSRQQSAFNRQTLTALQELAECCALLSQATGTRSPGAESEKAASRTLQELLDQIAETRQRLLALERRLKRLEEAKA